MRFKLYVILAILFVGYFFLTAKKKKKDKNKKSLLSKLDDKITDDLHKPRSEADKERRKELWDFFSDLF
jgi:uncharacterized ion transporter superfamily protein YfcC